MASIPSFYKTFDINMEKFGNQKFVFDGRDAITILIGLTG